MVTRKLLITVITIPLVLPKAKKVGDKNDGQDWKRKKERLSCFPAGTPTAPGYKWLALTEYLCLCQDSKTLNVIKVINSPINL